VFRGVKAAAVMAALAFGVGLYAIFTFWWTPIHYIHLMVITLFACIAVALLLNWLMGGRARLAGLAAA
jgi:SSS family solute:Na+ symporter